MATKPKTKPRSKKPAPVVEAPAEASAPLEVPTVEHEPEDDSLTARRRAFAYEYLRDRNGTQAAIRAGYAESGAHVEASRLLRNPKVQAIIEDGERRSAIRAQIDADYVLDGAIEVAERCLQRRPVMTFDKVEKAYVHATDDEGNDIWTFDSTGAMKAFSLIAKRTGGFADKLEVSGKISLEDILTKSREVES
jgi:phage terminase small subunit